ncbi:MAG TPA: hypothetical protein VGL77_14830 [Armatimonadota bacterium]|jgi:hypothetical protein
MDTREAFVAKLKAQLDEWNADIDKMEARARQAQADKQIAYNEHLVTLKQHRDTAQQQLAQVQQSSGDAWEEMKLGIEAAWARIAEAFTHARARLDEPKAA